MKALDSSFAAQPYPGLRPFTSEESDIFFGREEQIDKLLEKLQREHFVAVVGASGCGKSSLVKAGLIAGLESGFMGDTGHRWHIAELRPGSNPLAGLADALLASGALTAALQGAEQAHALAYAQLRSGPLGLVELARDGQLGGGRNLLILVDQFEEIFRFRRLGDANVADAFVSLLLATVQRRELPIFVVITMRSDFLGDCAVFRGLPEAINESQFLTPRLTRAQMQLAIVGPARVFGGDVDAGLVNRLLNDVGPNPDQLPVLQHALMRMWSLVRSDAKGAQASAGSEVAAVMTLEQFEQSGGLSTALSNHADEVFDGLPPELRKVAMMMFRCLTDRGEERRDTRRPASLRELAEVSGATLEQAMTVVEAFRAPGVSFLTPARPTALSPEVIVDISHESLIRLWKRLAVWVDEEARKAVTYERLRQAALAWKAGEADAWEGRALASILEWKQETGPTLAWAKRYACAEDFETAMAFVDAGRKRARAQRARRTATWGTFALLAAICVAVVWWQEVKAGLDRRSRDFAARSLDILGVDAESAFAHGYEAVCLNPDGAPAMESLAQALDARREQNRLYPKEDTAKLVGYTTRGPWAVTSADGQLLRIVNAKDGSSVGELRVQDPDTDRVVMGAGGTRMLTWTSRTSTTLAVWKLDGAASLFAEIPHAGRVEAAALSADEKAVALADADGQVVIWDLSGPSPSQVVRFAIALPKDSRFIRLELSGDASRLLALASRDDGQLRPAWVAAVWDRRSSAVREIRGSDDVARDAALLADNDEIAVVTEGFTADVTMFRLDTGKQVRSTSLGISAFPSGNPTNRTIAFAPDAEMLAVVSATDGSLRVLNWITGDEIEVYDSAGGVWILDVAFSPDRRELVTSMTDRSVRVWSLTQRPVPARLSRVAQTQAALTSAAVSPDGIRAAIGTREGTVLLWGRASNGFKELSRDVPETVWDGPNRMPNYVHVLDFSADGTLLVAGYEDGHARVWNALSGSLVSVTRHPHRNRVKCAGFDPYAKRIVTSSEDGTVRIWDADKGVERRSWPGHDGASGMADPPVCAAFSSDGTQIIAVGAQGRIYEWQASGGQSSTERQLGESELAGAALYPPDQFAVRSKDYNRNARVLRDKAGVALNLPGGIQITNFAAHGRRIMTIDAGQTVSVWDVGEPDALDKDSARRLVKFGREADLAALSADGRTVLIAGRGVIGIYQCRACRLDDEGVRAEVRREADLAAETVASDPSLRIGDRFPCWARRSAVHGG